MRSAISTQPTLDDPNGSRKRRMRSLFSLMPLQSLWTLQGVPVGVVVRRTWSSLLADRLFGRAAELGFYFLFALFPTLFSASSLLGLAARSAAQIYDKLLSYLALVIPTAAMSTVLNTFNETAAASTSGKVTFGLIAAIWSASVGISAMQDTLNGVYKVPETRSYLGARLNAIALTVLLTLTVTLELASMLGGDYLAGLVQREVSRVWFADLAALSARLAGWAAATILLAFSFAVVYCWAPDVRPRKWRWFTPGGTVGIFGWLAASMGLRIYLHFFNNYSVTYGSLGAVIILLTWFYISGLMLLLGAEINSEIEAAVAERKLASKSALSKAAEVRSAP